MWLKPDPKSPAPMSVQIRQDILAALVAKRYRQGDMLPSVRGLASEILVNPNTVAKVYRDLERDGFLEAKRGSGMLVSEDAESKARSELRTNLHELAGDLIQKARQCGLEGADVHTLLEGLLLEAGPASIERSTR